MLATATLKYLLLNCLLWGCLFANAQFNTTPTVSYIDVNQGLSNNSVSCIYQDRKGFMWFGTSDGLNRYDGYKFTIFRNNVNDTNSILKNWITAINEDEHNNVWVGTLNGLSIYEPSKGKFFTPTFLKDGNPVPQKIDFEITGVVVDKQHNKFIASHKGLFLRTNNSKPAVRVPLYANNKLVKDFNVVSISFDSVLNKVWLYVSEVGLCLYNPANQQVRLVRAIEKYASCISVEAGKKVWVAANNKLYAYDVAANNLAIVNVANLGEVRCLTTDRSGILWIATNGRGIYFKRPDSTAVHKLLLGENNEWLENSAVFALYEDQDNRKWIGTIRAGIVAISQQKNQFTTIADTKPSNMAKNYMLSFLEDSAQNLWVATDGAGLRYWDRKKNTFTDLVNKPGDDNSIGSNNVTRLIRDHEGSVWAATWFGCVNRLNKGSNTFKRYHCVNPYSKTEDKNVWLLYEDRLQRLWASAWSLYRLNKTTDRFEIFDSSLTGILTLAEDNTGSLWGGSYTSLIKIDTLHKKHTTYAIGYPVRAIHQDKAGNFWIGTEGGGLLLFDRNTGHYTRATEENGLPNNSILNILEDSSGSLWLSTYRGLSCYNTRTKIFKNFTQADGLQSNQFSYNAALALSSGELVFGGIKGFNVFYPAGVANKPGTHTVLVNSITIDNVPIEKNPSYVTSMVNGDVQELTVPYEHAVISVDFVTLDYGAADKIKYAYYMEGWDKGWNYMGNTRTANYSRLEPGSYTFKMKSTNEDGSWSTKETMVAITILPPWYKTWWAYLLYVLAVVSAIYLYIRYTKKTSLS
jgi:ligand-binding sensor domain-containing protein